MEKPPEAYQRRRPPPDDLREPYRSLFLIFSDLWEQLELAKPNFKKSPGCAGAILIAQATLANVSAMLERAATLEE